jgi:2-methylcitrate dehydratase PrpD
LALDAAGKMEPTTGLEGKFSIPYCVANALVRGETGYRAFTDEKVNDPEVRALMKKIAVSLDQQVFGLASRVEVETYDGKVHSGFSDILQQIPPLAVKKERIRAKFFDLCEPVVGEKRTKKMAKDIARLEEIASMKSFTKGL